MTTIGLSSRAWELPKTESELETKPVVETPEFGSELGKLYMQYGDGSEATGAEKDGVVDFNEAHSLDHRVGESLDNNPESQLHIRAKALTDFIADNIGLIGQETNYSVSAEELEQVTGSRPDLTGPRLIGQKFESQSLSNANLENADFRFTSMYEVDLSGANLRGADFTGAAFTRVDLSGADLTGANLSDIRSESIWYDDKTVFPEGFDITMPSVFEKNPNTDTGDRYFIDESGTYSNSDIGHNSGIYVEGDDLDVTVNLDAGVNTGAFSAWHGPNTDNWVHIDAVNNSTVAVNGGDDGDSISISAGPNELHHLFGAPSTENMKVDVNTGGGNDEVVHRVAEGSSSGHITIDGGDGYDIFRSDFLSDTESTVVKNEDGSYTIHAGDQVIEVKNFEGFEDLSAPNRTWREEIIDI
ncbi:MAG: pentapeptide repeat-containing protein [Granulosicoccus sp.]